MLKILRRLISTPAMVEQRRIHLAGQPVSFTLKRSDRRRSVGLRVDGRGLTVSAPLRASEAWLHQVLQEKAGWVLEKLEIWQARQAAVPQWRDGHCISVLGEPVTLRVVASLRATPPQRQDAQLWVHVRGEASETAIARAVTRWYQREAMALLSARVAHYAPLMRVAPREVRLSSARTRWGSCTQGGNLRLNWQLVKLPMSLVDYVVVHELAHLVELNHSAAFWRVVEAACPDYAGRRRELRRWRLE